MAIPQNQMPANAEEMLRNMAAALGIEIEIKGAQEVMEGPKVKKRRAKKLPKALNPQQVEKLLAPIKIKCSTGLRNKTILLVMLKAGLRVSEVTNLTPADVDLSKGMILVQQGKGGRDRVIPIGEELMEWLNRWDETRPSGAQYFFCAVNKGTQLLPRYINQVLERLSNESGVFIQDGAKQGPVHAHCLRHTYATNLLEQGVNIREIQELLGHSSVSTTQIYASVNMVHLDAKIKALG